MTMHDPYHEGQGDTADLVRSLALSSAKLWEELFDRLRRIELAQTELRELVGKMEVALPGSSLNPALERGNAAADALPAAGEAPSFEDAVFGRSSTFGAPDADDGSQGFSWDAPSGDADWTAPPPIWSADQVDFALGEVAPPPPPPTVTFEDPVSTVTFEAPVSTAEFGFSTPAPNGFAPLAPPFETGSPAGPPSGFTPTAPPPPAPAGFAPTAPPSPPPAPEGFAPAPAPAPAPPPPPPFGFAPAPPPSNGLHAAPSEAPPVELAQFPPPPPPFGYTLAGSVPPGATGVYGLADVPSPAGVTENTAVPAAGDQPTAEPARALQEPEPSPPPITPDFFARAGRRRA